MKILTSFSAALLRAYLFGKNAISKKLQLEYEKNLLKGDKKMAVKTGRLYYNTLPPQKKKEKGVINVDKKILKDFKEFNVMNCF